MHVFNLFSQEAKHIGAYGRGKQRITPHAGVSRRSLRTGFTLIELIVVIVIMAIAASIVISQAATANWFTMHGTITSMMRDLEYVQAEAMLDQQKLNVRFNAGNDSYFVFGSADNASSSINHPMTQNAMYPVSLAQAMDDDRTQIQGATFTSNNPSSVASFTFLETGEPVQFVSLGSSNYNNNANRTPIHQNSRIVLVSGGQTLQLRIAPVTGLMRVD